MTLTRTSFFTSSLLSSLLFLLVCGLSLPVAASPYRSHGSLTPRASAATLSYATVLRGRASWYGRRHQGLLTSSGERFNRFKYTCAHKTLPFGTRLRVTNIQNGKSVVVRVSDRGPFRHQRILDLAEVAARPLGIIDQGAATVIAQVVPATTPLGPAASPRNLGALRAADPNPKAAFTTYQLTLPATTAPAAVAVAAPAPPAPALTEPVPVTAPSFVVQTGSFAEVAYAQAMQAHLRALDPTLSVELTHETTDGEQVNRVFIGQLDNLQAAEALRQRLQLWGVAGVVHQLPAEPVAAAEPPVPRS